jgi:tetratricopeptide (TPR) repeat protein
VYFDIASAYFVEGGGKLDKAIEYYSKLIDEYPESKLVMEARFYSAAALEEKGELAEALKAYEELLPIYPNPRMVELRIEGVKNIIDKKASPASPENFMGIGATEGENTNGTEGAVKEVGGGESTDGIVIKTPNKNKETTPGEVKKDDTKK